MMHSMMSDAGSAMLFWMILILFLSLLLVGLILRLAFGRLMRPKTTSRHVTALPHESWPTFEQACQEECVQSGTDESEMVQSRLRD